MSSPTTIKQRGSSSNIVTAIVSPGASTLAQLGDVNVSSLTNGNVLVYNSTTGRWTSQPSIAQVDGGTYTSAGTLIKLRYVNQIGLVPGAGDLQDGEVLLNIADGKLFFKDGAGSIVTLSEGGGAGGGASELVHVRAASTSNISGVTYDDTLKRLTFAMTDYTKFDGVTIVSGNRVLIKDQTDARYNGVYTVSSVDITGASPWVLVRSTGFQTTADYESAKFFIVQEGATIADTIYIVSNNEGTINLDNAALSFVSPFGVFSVVNVGNNAYLTPTGLGIGTSSPTDSIDVTGGAKLGGDLFVRGDENELGNSNSAANIFLKIGKDRVNNGNAFIELHGASGGTATATLSTAGSTGDLSITSTGKTTFTTTGLGIGGATVGAEKLAVTGNSIFTGTVNVTSDLRVDTNLLFVQQSTGFVGIGKTPTTKLDVNGNTLLGGTLGVTGNTTLTGDLAVNGGDITSSATTFNLVDSTVTTLNIGGAATTVNIGEETDSATNIGWNLVVANDISAANNSSFGSASNDTHAFTGVVTVTGQHNIDNVRIDGNTVSITNTDGNLVLDPNGTGIVSVGSSMTVDNSLTVTQNAGVGGNLTVTGNLIVNGSTTTINSTVTTIDDPVITLGGDTAPSVDDNKDRGIEFRWHNGATAKVGFFGFDDSTGKFVFIPDATNSSEVFSGSKGTIDASIEWADVLSKPDPVITVDGDISGVVTLTDLTNQTLTLTLDTVNANVGDFTKVTVNAKGLVTAATTLIDSDIPSTLSANARVSVKYQGSEVAKRRGINIVETSDVDWTVSDDSGNEEVDVSLVLATQGGVTPNSGYNTFTVNSKGIITAASTTAYLLAANESTDFKTVTVSDTDSGYTWAATGSAAAETLGDTLTIVSGDAINVDVDSTADAIRITNTDKGSSQNIFKTITVSDTDSGYTWGETGNVTAASNNDTVTIVSGAGIDIDVDSTSKAIKIINTGVLTEADTLDSVTGRGATTTNAVTFGGVKTTTNVNFNDKSLMKAGEIAAVSNSSPTLLYSTDRKAAKISVKLNRNNTEYQISEFLIITDGTTPTGTEYGVVYTGAAALATFTVVQNGSTLEFYGQAANADTSATFLAHDLA